MIKQMLGTKNDVNTTVKNTLNNKILHCWQEKGIFIVKVINDLPEFASSDSIYFINANVNIENNLLYITGTTVKFDSSIFWKAPIDFEFKRIYFEMENKKALENILKKYTDGEYEIIEQEKYKWFKKHKIYSAKFKRVTPLLNEYSKRTLKLTNWLLSYEE